MGPNMHKHMSCSMMSFDCHMFHLADFDVHNPPIPQPLPKMPPVAWESVEEAELEEVADTGIDDISHP